MLLLGERRTRSNLFTERTANCSHKEAQSHKETGVSWCLNFNSAYLGALCDSAVILFYARFTAETQRAQRFAEKISKIGHYPAL
jgi:hypothetical protein